MKPRSPGFDRGKSNETADPARVRSRWMELVPRTSIFPRSAAKAVPAMSESARGSRPGHASRRWMAAAVAAVSSGRKAVNTEVYWWNAESRRRVWNSTQVGAATAT